MGSPLACFIPVLCVVLNKCRQYLGTSVSSTLEVYMKYNLEQSVDCLCNLQFFTFSNLLQLALVFTFLLGKSPKNLIRKLILCCGFLNCDWCLSASVIQDSNPYQNHYGKKMIEMQRNLIYNT